MDRRGAARPAPLAAPSGSVPAPAGARAAHLRLVRDDERAEPAAPGIEMVGGLVARLAEVLAAERPAWHLAALLAPRAYERLCAVAPAPLPAVDRRRVRLRRIRSCRTAPDVIEVCAVIQYPDRVRGLALRLERRAAHWWCTDLAIPESLPAPE